jgi:glycerol kinase
MKNKLTLDQGTTSSRAIVFNHAGEIVSVSKKPFEQLFPKPGWVEQEIWSSQISCAAEVDWELLGKKLRSLINVKRRSFGIGKPAKRTKTIELLSR